MFTLVYYRSAAASLFTLIRSSTYNTEPGNAFSQFFSAFFYISLHFSVFYIYNLGQFDGAYHRPMDAIFSYRQCYNWELLCFETVIRVLTPLITDLKITWKSHLFVYVSCVGKLVTKKSTLATFLKASHHNGEPRSIIDDSKINISILRIRYENWWWYWRKAGKSFIRHHC